MWGYFSEQKEGREAVGGKERETEGSCVSLTKLCAPCPTTSKSTIATIDGMVEK